MTVENIDIREIENKIQAREDLKTCLVNFKEIINESENLSEVVKKVTSRFNNEVENILSSNPPAASIEELYGLASPWVLRCQVNPDNINNIVAEQRRFLELLDSYVKDHNVEIDTEFVESVKHDSLEVFHYIEEFHKTLDEDKKELMLTMLAVQQNVDEGVRGWPDTYLAAQVISLLPSLQTMDQEGHKTSIIAALDMVLDEVYQSSEAVH